MANNQDFVRNLFRDIAADGFAKKFEDALDDDLVWVATGSSPLSGEYKGKQVYLEKIIGQLHTRLQSWPKAIVENILVDGDVACVQFHGEGGIGKNGANFDMQYCWVMKVRNQKIDWLIFKSGPSEMGVHPTHSVWEGKTYDHPRQHSIAIMCDDIDATVDELRGKGAQFRGPIEEREYGRIIMMIVPGADDMQLYQPTHKLAYNL